MKLSALKGGVQRVWVTVPADPEVPGSTEEKVWVDYRPGELTFEVAEQMRLLNADGFEADAVRIFLEPILVGWDLQNEDGSPLPVSELKKVPIPFLGQVMNAMAEEVRPTPLKESSSGDTSRQEEPQERSLTGTSSSEQQIDSGVASGT